MLPQKFFYFLGLWNAIESWIFVGHFRQIVSVKTEDKLCGTKRKRTRYNFAFCLYKRLYFDQLNYSIEKNILVLWRSLLSLSYSSLSLSSVLLLSALALLSFCVNVLSFLIVVGPALRGLVCCKQCIKTASTLSFLPFFKCCFSPYVVVQVFV